MKEISADDQFKLEVIQFVQEIQNDLPRLCRIKPNTPISKNPLKEFLRWLPEIMSWYHDYGLVANFTAAHGRGHIIRDILNTLIMLPGTPMHPDDALAAAIGGLAHDLAVGSVYRYAEKNNIGHADVSGYLLKQCLSDIGFTAKNQYAAGMAIFNAAAHTFYGETKKVSVGDKEYDLPPYQTLAPNGEVLVASDITNGIDQADCMSGFFVGRHFVSTWDTVDGQHDDYDNDQFHVVKFADHLRVVKEADGQFPKGTALRHFTTFANSQLSFGRFSRYHYGDVRRVLTTYAPQLLKVTEKVYADYLSSKTGGEDHRTTIEKWLLEKVTYHDGPNEVKIVMDGLSNLDDPIKTAWFNGLKLAQELSIEQVRFMRQELGEERIAQLPKNLPVLGSGLHDMLAR